LLRAKAAPDLSPVDTLRRVNRVLLDTNDSGLFVTVLYGSLNLETGELDYARAGHEIPILMRSSGETYALPFDGGVPLGIIERPLLDEKRVDIRPGELLLLYTDGVTDGLNLASDAIGTEELETLMRLGNGLGSQAFCAHLSEAVNNRQGAKPQFDDVTLVAIRATE
jgi:sigma-B regulation protein RsbU (phosphoserine phosphatase)